MSSQLYGLLSGVNAVIEHGDVFKVLKRMTSKPENKLRFSAIITSPPYYRQRHYGDSPHEIGREKTVEEYLDKLTEVFRLCRPLLKNDGTIWIVIGDARDRGSKLNIPNRLAGKLEDVGYKFRDSIIWYKKNHMSSSTTAGLTSAYEHILYLAKGSQTKVDKLGKSKGFSNVWDIATLAHKGQKHYAMYPEPLVARIIDVATKPDDHVLDVFAGRGTTGIVCAQMGRHFTGIELYEDYQDTARKNIKESHTHKQAA
ncbi:MAG: site-specific DNA-methyltransferase [Nitrososphaera sp.]